MSDRLDAMRLFVRVAEAGSFSRAAELEGVTQPTVSRRIAELEARLGAQLVRRTTRALSLTEAGERFLTRARSVLDEFDEAAAEVRGLERALVGVLRVTAPITMGRVLVAPAVAGFLDRHPHVRLDLSLDNRFVDMAQEGFDLAFRVGALTDSSMTGRRIGRSPQILFAAPGTCAAGASLDDIASATFALFPNSGPARLTLSGPDGATRTLDVDARVRSNAPEVVREAALSGVGVGVGSQMLVCDDVEAGRLVRVAPGWAPAPSPIHALWPSGRRLGAKARAFLEHIAEHITARGFGPA